MADRIVGTATFSCYKNGSFAQFIDEDVSLPADWRMRPADARALLEQEARRLSRVPGKIGREAGCQRAIFTGDVTNYIVTKRGVFTCDIGKGQKARLYHDVYTLRLQGERAAETDRRLALEGVERHQHDVVLDCKGSVAFTGEFVEPAKPMIARMEPSQSWWHRFIEALKESFSTAVTTQRHVAEDNPAWSYDR